MPTVTEQHLAGWAHCEDPMCAGNSQEPVEVVRTTTELSFRDSGGDLPGTEKSFERYSFASEADLACPVCDKPRAAAAQKRPVYPTSQWPQDGLLKLIRDGNLGQPVSEATQRHDGEIDELKAQIAELKAMVGEKRGPGRPRRQPDEDGAA